MFNIKVILMSLSFVLLAAVTGNATVADGHRVARATASDGFDAVRSFVGESVERMLSGKVARKATDEVLGYDDSEDFYSGFVVAQSFQVAKVDLAKTLEDGTKVYLVELEFESEEIDWQYPLAKRLCKEAPSSDPETISVREKDGHFSFWGKLSTPYVRRDYRALYVFPPLRPMLKRPLPKCPAD